MIETLFIQAKTKAGFEAKLSASEVKPESIAFIEDTREIWTQGVYYPMSEIVTVSSLPGESLLSYNLEGTNYKYRIGDECRFYDTDKQEYRFYKLFDISDGRAKWGLVEGTTELASPSLDGLMSKEDKKKLDGLAQADWNANSGGAQILNKPDIYTKTEVNDLIEGVNIPGVYKYKGSKPTYQDLPTQSNEVGDVWNVVKTDINYAWTGTDWDPLGGTSSMASTTEAGLMSSENFTKLQGIEAKAQVNKIESITFAGEPIEISGKAVAIPEEVHTSSGVKPETKVPIWVDLSESEVVESYTKEESNELFQTKVPGKGLSTNDFTNPLKNKLDGIEEDAQVNIKPDWNASAGNAAEILNKPTIPTKTSQLSNDSNYTTKTYVDGEIAKVHQFEVKKVKSLPQTGDSNVLYLVSKSGSGQDVYNEYIWDGSKFELIGNTSINLSNCYTKEEVNSKVPVITVSADEPSGGKDGDIWFQIVTQ